MRFVADENFPRAAVEALRQNGFDVLWIAETCPGAPDEEVLGLCTSTNRILITFDKDFGELAYHRRLPADSGILLFRMTRQNPEDAAALALSANPIAVQLGRLFCSRELPKNSSSSSVIFKSIR